MNLSENSVAVVEAAEQIIEAVEDAPELSAAEREIQRLLVDFADRIEGCV